MVSQLRVAQSALQVLLVGQDQEGHHPTDLSQNLMQLLSCVANPVAVAAVYHEDDPVDRLEVIFPGPTHLLLPREVPDLDAHIFDLELFQIVANGRRCREGLPGLVVGPHFVEDGGLAGGVKADQDQLEVLLRPREEDRG